MPEPRTILAHGIDLVEVARVRDLLARHGERFLSRVFTPAEQAHGKGSRRYPEHLAARFAAKEATMKALGCGLANGVAWTDIEVLRLDDGRPMLHLHNAAAALAASQGTTAWHISLSHTDTHAIASVIAT